MITSAIAIIAALEISSDLNNWMQLVKFPQDLKFKLIVTMIFDFGGAWLIEQITSKLFSDNKPREELLIKSSSSRKKV